MRTRQRMHTVLVLSASLLLPAAPAVGQIAFNQVALTGEVAPGIAGGAEFNFFTGTPAINDSGDVAFSASLLAGSGTDVTFDNNNAIFGPIAGAGSALGLIAREDALAPGVADGAEFSSFESPVLNASGDVAFEATLRTGSGADVTFDINTAIFGPTSGAGSALGLIAREGGQAPGVNDGAEFFNFSPPVLNASGDVAFETTLRTGSGAQVITSGPDANLEAIFGPTSGAGSALGLVARSDTPAPGAEGAEFAFFFDIALNASGDVGFEASLRTGSGAPVVDVGPDADNSAIFGPTSGAGSALGLIAREDAPAPGVADGAEFDGFDRAPALNASGDVAFEANLRTGSGAEVVTSGPDANNSAIFGPTSGVGSPLGLIVRENDPAPGVADGAKFSFFDKLALNASGDVAFDASLRTGSGPDVTFVNDKALFALLDGELQLIVRTGDTFDVTVNGLVEERIISGIDFDTNGLSDSGVLAFELQFTDFTEGLFTADVSAVPEPTSLALLAIGGLLAASRRRRDA